MLVLGRKEQQRTVITTEAGEKIVVVVCGVDRSNGQVKLGFEAPSTVRIDREENVR